MSDPEIAMPLKAIYSIRANSIAGKTAPRHMNSASIKFFLCALGLHLIVLGIFWHGASVEHGMARDLNSLNTVHSVLRVEIVADKQFQQPSFASEHRVGLLPALDQNIPTEKLFSKVPSKAFGPAAYFTVPEQIITSYYFQAGRLTRLPAPVSDIDLDVPDIHDMAFTGVTELTILIDERGTVIDVLTSMEPEGIPLFVDLVIARFKNARFIPGEINGKAVKSQLQITVVSENLSASEI